MRHLFRTALTLSTAEASLRSAALVAALYIFVGPEQGTGIVALVLFVLFFVY